ncbi:MAG: UbiD family decarboxylase [Thaumarchaeota archaeon]|nr:MAG: UbiD family decarboxylase [Nitrososphaerota archaeon]
MVGLRDFLFELEKLNLLVKINRSVSTRFEAAAVIKRLEPKPIIFTNIKGYEDFRLAANIAADRKLVARSLNISEGELLNRLIYAIENPSKGEVVEDAPCQEIIIRDPDLRKLPFLIFGERDGGPYLTAGIVIAYDPEYGFNASYHRLMLIGKNKVVARILPRHLNTYIERGCRDVAITIGNHPAFMLASAVSWKLGVSELDIANTLRPMKYTWTITNNLLVPADCEVVLEGRVTDEWADEGPFIDITGTYDIVRKQRIIEINCITMRRDPIFQQILPGGSEHRFLMGTPREATIFREVSKVCEVLDVRLTSGGCNWLHCVMKIKKRNEDDGRRAIEAAFKAHKSLKYVIVVDEDIDISNPSEIEWALATRTQLDEDLILKPGELGSSLDPSADQVTRITCKAGVDATIPFDKDREKFIKAKIPGEDELKLEDYIR